jgi:hypothetical protein
MTEHATPSAGNAEPPENLVNLLDELVLPAEPDAISMVPQTAGWLVLGALLIMAVGWMSWRFVSRYRANAYRRAALMALADAGENPAAIGLVLRQTALAAYPRTQVAGLFGEDWLRFLDRTAGDSKARFLRGPGQALNAVYDPAAPPSADLPALARDWVKHHLQAVSP